MNTLFNSIFLLFLFASCFEAAHYNFFNGTSLFAQFRVKFRKIYDKLKNEQAAFTNFLENLNKVSVLNESRPDNITIYVLNKYADLDPTEVQEHYAINLKPYDVVRSGDKNALRSNRGVDINNANLFDLENAHELYKKYEAKYKKNYTDIDEYMKHYYRFVKTLIEKNKEIYEGKANNELDDQADIIKHKDDFFY